MISILSNPDYVMFQDGESGWGSLHRALHFGHLAVASILLQSGASLTLEDSKSRTPVDLLSGPLSEVIGSGRNSGMPLCFHMLSADLIVFQTESPWLIN